MINFYCEMWGNVLQRIGHMNRAGIETVRPFFHRTEPNGFIGTKFNNNKFLKKHWADLLKSPQLRESPAPRMVYDAVLCLVFSLPLTFYYIDCSSIYFYINTLLQILIRIHELFWKTFELIDFIKRLIPICFI